MGIGEFALGLVTELLATAIERGIALSALPYFKQRRVKRRVEDATAEVIEPLLPFLSHEHIPEDKQYRLIETCVTELRPLAEKPELLFQGSLNGQKIFEQLYGNDDLPAVILDDGLKDVYTLLFPRIATLLCKIPAAVKDWENEAWSENFRRFDELTAQMLGLFNRVDELAALPLREADETLTILRRTLAQKIGIELDLTGLRADRPVVVNFEALFVFPSIHLDIARSGGPFKALETPQRCFTEVKSSPNSHIIVGAAGAGKSTWSKWLQQEALSIRWNGIPVRVELRRFSSGPLLSLHDLIREAAGKHLAEELNAERVRRWLDSRQLMFILDGFDEVPTRIRDEVHEWIRELKSAACRCPFILTSRVLTTDHLERFGADWKWWSIKPFDERRVIDYIERWYACMPLLSTAERKINPKKLTTTWYQDPTIGPLTGNPLLLSTLLMVHHLDGKLPTGRAQLYRRYVEGMLGIWDDRRKVEATSTPISLEKKKQILRGLALKMFLQEKDQLDEAITVDTVNTLIQSVSVQASAEETLAILRERSSLLVGPGIYSFIHKSVAEFLVAEAIVQGDQRDECGVRIDRFKLFEKRNDDRWNTVTFLWAGLAPVSDVESFIDACIQTNALALAYGMLLDQYDRFTLESRHRFLRPLIEGRSVPCLDMSSKTWELPRPNSVAFSLPVPFCSLRGIAIHFELRNLLARAYHDDPRLFYGYTHSPPEFRDLVWMITVLTPVDLLLWREFLKEPLPDVGDKVGWVWLISYKATWTAVHTNVSYNLSDIIEGMAASFPNDYGVVALAIMTIMLESATILSQQRIIGALQALININPTSIDEWWLGGTAFWQLPSRDKLYRPENVDLLKAFINFLNRYIKLVSQEDKDTCMDALKYSEELQLMRQSLVNG